MKKNILILLFAGLFGLVTPAKTRSVVIKMELQLVDLKTSKNLADQMVLIYSFNGQIPDTAYTDKNGLLRHTYRHHPPCRHGLFRSKKYSIVLVVNSQKSNLKINRRYGHPAENKEKKVFKRTITV